MVKSALRLQIRNNAQKIGMEALKKRHIKPGYEYDHLFPAAMAGTETVVRDAGLSDTVAFIPKVVADTLHHTKGIAAKLKGSNTYNTCRNIWQFVYNHVAYRKDRDGYEQIRSPARTWADRSLGVDCDCYSTFISSILTNLGIAHQLRITKYSKAWFQHIYPVVPYGGQYIILDCVTDKFDHEVPYTEKKDIIMELQYLNGWDGLDEQDERGSDYVFDGSDMGELGLFGRKRKKAAVAAAAQPLDPNAIPPSGVKKKRGLKKLFSKVNKINPLTVLLRNGVLAAMKLNMFKIASRLRWSYMSPNAAAAKGIIPDKFKKLVAVRQKLENTFHGAGGKVDNLRKAILKGKGNKDKAVAVFGLGFLPEDGAVDYMDLNTPLPELLGHDIYYSENVEGMEDFQGFGALGEPVSAATIAAATAVLTAIAKLLKGVGNIFGKGQQGSEDFDENAVAASDAETTASLPPATTASVVTAQSPSTVYPSTSSGSSSVDADTGYDGDSMGDDTAFSTTKANIPAATNTATLTQVSDPSSTEKESFWRKNKKWLLPAAIGVGGIAVIAIGMKLLKPSTSQDASMDGLNGLGKGRKKKSARNKNKHSHKTAVALL